MPSSPTLIFMAIFLLESLAAMLQNGFIITVLGKQWVRCRTLPTGDMIVICLAASRFCLHGISILTNFLVSSYLCYKTLYLNIFWDFSNTLIFWLTTWLAIFYCVKISSFSHPVFLWLKWRITWLVPKMLLSSLIFSSLSATSSATLHVIVTRRIISDGNCTLTHATHMFYWHYYRSHAMLVWFAPLFLFFLAIVLLMFSLYWHVAHMKNHRLGPRDPSTQAHTRALKSLVLFLIFYTWYSLCLIIHTIKITAIQDAWHWAKEVITYAGICLHSTILMLSSPKLRKALKMRVSGLRSANS